MERKEENKLDPKIASIFPTKEKLQEHCQAVENFLAGIESLWSTYDEIEKGIDYSGRIRVYDSRKNQSYLFFFRVWRIGIKGEDIIDSSGKFRSTNWHIPTLLVETQNEKDETYLSTAEQFKTTYRFAIISALIEMVEKKVQENP